MADKSLTLSCAQSGTSFTTKLNDALEAINTMRSGSSAPTNNLEDGVMWLDTSGADKVIKIRIGGVFHPLLDFDGSNWFAERAETATKLTTARTISLTGKVTGSTTFDGTANKSIATTLDTSGTWTGTATSATSAGTASTATKLSTARTITLGTDLSGNVNFDGGSNVTLNATLDADTVGDSELAAGGTLANGKVLIGTGDTTFAWGDAAASGGGFLSGAGSIVATGNRMVVYGSGGGAGSVGKNGANVKSGGSGFYVYNGIFACAEGETITVVVGGGSAGGSGTSASSDADDTTYTGSTSGVIANLGGAPGTPGAAVDPKVGGAGGTLEAGTLLASVASGSSSGSYSNITFDFPGGIGFGDYGEIGGAGGAAKASGTNSGASGYSFIVNFFSV